MLKDMKPSEDMTSYFPEEGLLRSIKTCYTQMENDMAFGLVKAVYLLKKSMTGF